jgi:CxxC motif-containing protein (DUF1111 family)
MSLVHHVALAALTMLLFTAEAVAVAPATAKDIAAGRRLFNKQWTSRNPALGSDGLGPLFNAVSCATCHEQGGIGGSGGAEHNALAIGIEELHVTGGQVTQDVLKGLLRNFYPGFIQPDGTMLNTVPLPHHGGTEAFKLSRKKFLSMTDAEYSEEGGPVDPAEVRQSLAKPIDYQKTAGNFSIRVRARAFGRNTTSLFGSGLIDQVSEREIRKQEKLQQRHAEISGRPSTLRDGRIGKFGWRANMATLLDFSDQACAAELGLKTKRRDQPTDVTFRFNRNPQPDIDDDSIRAMTHFIAALPTPTRLIPEEPQKRIRIKHGESIFHSVGCAVCHVPDMAPARGLYSDLLLHDMGPNSYDLNHAEPYIRRVTPVSVVTKRSSTTTTLSPGGSSGYFGGSSSISTTTSRSSVSFGRFNQFHFIAPTRPSQRVEVVAVGSDTHIRLQIEPTNFNQEWRTAPLWGLKDSAPYMHDGRAETILEAISLHAGEAEATRNRFLALPLKDRHALIAFLNSLAAPQQQTPQHPKLANNH